ncbi:glycoside hydrolase family 94 protein [Pseudoxanthomonas winnipegensis]|uniref:Cyclic beta 1-2 glucan synthetase n=1 Tax=Pseudoxanthomonas winnipegensis TaxID=2480810 RepID=A0A4Q8M6Z3_9GAMM|nr:cyclic beta 1-2 glucan synthetase [Pseudoxanthomonas winnipegensis]
MRAGWRRRGRRILRRLLARWRQRHRDAVRTATPEPPLRAQLFNATQMEQLGRRLSQQHTLQAGQGPERMLARLAENGAVLEGAVQALDAFARDKLPMVPAGEWLLDNYYLIDEQVRLARRHLPSGYSRALPALASGPSAGLPRVYDLAMQAVSHGDGQVDAQTLERLINGYQQEQALSIGELWAVPIMLRLAVIENLRRIAARITRDVGDHRLAQAWAKRMAEAAQRAPKDVVLVLADMLRSQPPVRGAFVSELLRHLRGGNFATHMPIDWLEQWVAESGRSLEAVVQRESIRQAAAQASIRNSIGSLRFITSMDWRGFVERCSVIEHLLRQDPDGTYPAMDFASRDQYRRVVETVARRAGRPEGEIAAMVLERARAAAAAAPGGQGHVGWWLLGDGAREIARALAGRGWRRVLPDARPVPMLAYIGPIAVFAALFAAGLLGSTLAPAVPAWGWLAGAAVLALLAFSELGVALVNWTASNLVTPHPLPSLDYQAGIPAQARTLVIVPSMIPDTEAVDELVDALEVRFLANRGPHLHFGLLTDFADAAQEHLPQDAAVLAHAQARIAALNARHGQGRDAAEGELFYLFHRPRQWNPHEGRWMGLERKRGKLAALNALLREGDAAPFSCIVGRTEVLRGVRYVITLDADTQLPLESARALVGTMAHPLNRPVVDPDTRTVVRGYGILQPGLGSAMALRSRYARMFGSEAGIDPYTRTISDVYQDLFAEGSFVGKGIYEVEAFEQVLAGRMPDNAILSHDLLEGCYARAGLVSQVRLYEDYPERYFADAKRRQRWVRGDWQLLPWLLPRVPTARGWERSPLSWLSRGKLADNLRRSLVPIAALTLLVAGWCVVPAPLVWTLWLLCPWWLPPLLAALRDALAGPGELPLDAHLSLLRTRTLRELRRAAVTFACLPHQAGSNALAIVRTLWRLAVSRRHLLQWNVSRDVERSVRGEMPEVALMWPVTVFAVGVLAAVALLQPWALPAAVPCLALWAASPWLMGWLGRRPPAASTHLDDAQRRFLGQLARRTWAFFETWVGPQEHWLPPDNLQEHPAQVLARRTSPTNIGLSLLANLSAWDLGYLQLPGVLTRVRGALDTLGRLERHRGHLYNWYTTDTLRPLAPRYVSTVDSGNLTGHLLTLRQGLLQLADAPLLAPKTFDGLADTLGALEDDVQRAGLGEALAAPLQAFADALQPLRTDEQASAPQVRTLLERAHALDEAATQAALPRAPIDWPARLLEACQSALAMLEQAGPLPAGEHTVPATLRALADAEPGGLAARQLGELEALAELAARHAEQDYRFLYDPAQRMLSIGYNVDESRLDAGFYDLLASEARLGCFVAIAQGRLPQESWFALGRLLTEGGGEPVLVSWSGSMFEYLMPQLVMPSYPGSLLDQTAHGVVQAQIEYGQARQIPWGVSESGYNAVDVNMNYQYRAFGVPGLGLKRGLAQDAVIAPYATVMALMVHPPAALENLQAMAAQGFSGAFGMYEAVDYTAERLPRGERHVVIRSYMAHHQGMALLSLDHLLVEQPMQKRFAADPALRAALLLLQERVPAAGVVPAHESEAPSPADGAAAAAGPQLRILRDPDGPRPEVQLLSNGRYHAMLTVAGGGYTRLEGTALTRWREDPTRDAYGSFCYLRDAESGEYWSAAYQPTCVRTQHFEAIFSQAKAEFRVRHRGIDSHLEIAVSAEDDIELRRLRLKNRARHPRTVEVTTYAEVVLQAPRADEAHPAFGNLFVQTRILAAKQAIVCRRRAREAGERPPQLLHLVAAHDCDIEQISYETDRARFIGRGRSAARPLAMERLALDNSEGSVLDPIVAIRVRITLQPGQQALLDLVTGVGEDEAACDALIEKYRDRRLADRVFDLAWTHSQVVHRQINAHEADVQVYERLAALVLQPDPVLRADADTLRQNRRAQPALWAQAISGDLPIVLLQVSDVDHLPLVEQVVQAHQYWRLKGLETDLVIWNESQAGYRQQLQEQILALLARDQRAEVLERRGGIFVRAVQQLGQEDRVLLLSVARVVLTDRAGTLAEQVDRLPVLEREPPAPLPAPPPRPAAWRAGEGAVAGLPPAVQTDPADEDPWPFEPLQAGPLQFDNGTGGFSADGREYVITVAPARPTPAPWSNLLANPVLGAVVTESGAGYSWGENAHEYRLTPWDNDPVCDSSGEAFYLRDEDSGHLWSPTPLPCPGSGAYRVRHGFGYSVFEHVEDGIHSELWLYVDAELAVKYSVLRLRNLSGRARRLSATGYVEWVLADLRSRSQMHLITDVDIASGVLTARNPFNGDFEGRCAFFDVDAGVNPEDGTLLRQFTADRLEFLGRNGSLAAPAGLRREGLSGRFGPGLDACAALQVPIALEAGGSFETTFRLGMAADVGATLELARRTRGAGAAHDALDRVRIHWRGVLGGIRVNTPDPAFDLLVNGWLLYQVIASRYFGRSGFYQSGGAWGFRDQLQDCMAMVHALPQVTREHLLRAAAQQFPQGDAMHWWHPPTGRGVRTRCSDDYLWLPLATCRYLDVTQDWGVLEARARFVEGRLVNDDEESYYDLPVVSAGDASLYEHCVLALRRGCRLLGERGLPLMGTGDWNDGMNKVGEHGRGESVWLGFFLIHVLKAFVPVAQRRGESAFADWCQAQADTLAARIEEHAWDGGWYRRAWFDDGTPLGSAQAQECRIDSISQSWAVLSGAGQAQRVQQAMTALDTHLVKPEAGIIQLLDPPFDRHGPDPGYIRGYVPGVRENGGQYTHAAVWTVMAFAELGQVERAWQLLEMINPIHHARDAQGVARYRVEPYVMAADVYAVGDHAGSGGWTWYTGSAGWMYRLLLESLLGLRREGEMLTLEPRVPAGWETFSLQYAAGQATYAITVRYGEAAAPSLSVDGVRQRGNRFALHDDGAVHQVQIDLPGGSP